MKIKELDTPQIIKNKENFYLEPGNICKPKFIVVIENMNFNTNIPDEESLSNLNVDSHIDYENKNTSSPNNIFNFFNKKHAELIKNINTKCEQGEERFDYYTSNLNFAYHYLVDKKGNIYEGRPHNVKAFNLDIFNPDGSLFPQNKTFFEDVIIIMTEEQTAEYDTTDATYTALKTLIKYLLSEYDFKDFYCFSEFMRYEHSDCSCFEKDEIRFNNPGSFFKINELHSAVHNKKLMVSRKPSNDIEIFTYGERNLKYHSINMKGNDVFMLQLMLYNLGLLKDYKEVNGIYGLKTKQTVETLQKLNYITPTDSYGDADINTLKILREEIYNRKFKNIEIYDDFHKNFRVLEVNEDNPMTGQDVVIIQTLLKNKIKSTLNITGIYNEETEKAVRIFQKVNFGNKTNLIDGKVGPITYSRLKSCKYSIPIKDNNIIDISQKQKNEIVVLLQKALNNFLKKYHLKITETGYFDINTMKYIELINSKKSNREVMDIEKYGKDNPNYWNKRFNLRKCYPEELDWIIENYLLDTMNSNIVI